MNIRTVLVCLALTIVAVLLWIKGLGWIDVAAAIVILLALAWVSRNGAGLKPGDPDLYR